MPPLPDDTPDWPPWMALAAPAVAWVGAIPATLLAALLAGLLGGDGDTPGAVLLAAVLVAAVGGGLVVSLLRSQGELTAAGLGLRLPPGRLLLVGLLVAAVAVAVVAALVAVVFDPFRFPAVPDALSAVDPGLRGDTDVTRVDPGAGVVAVLLAAVVLSAFAEVLARGIALPALARAMGDLGAALTVAGVGALLALLGGVDGGIVIGLLLLGLLNAWLYTETSSLLAPVAVSAAAGALVLCGGLQWDAGACAVAAVLAGLVGVALVAAGARLGGPKDRWVPRPRTG